MKRRIGRITFILIGCLCALGMLGGCSKTREDFIPEQLGVAEGLYLYYDNYRSLTDGTQKETLLDEIVLDGNIYPEGQFSIQSLEYVTSKKEIFYVVTIPDQEESAYHVWHYNYDSKESGLVYSFENAISLDTSDEYLIVYEYSKQNWEAQKTIVFDMDLTLLAEFTGRYLPYDDLIWNYTGNVLRWWKDGENFSVTTDEKMLSLLHKNEYIYLFTESELYFINANTGEYKTHQFGENKFFDVRDDYGSAVLGEDGYYFLTYQTLTPTYYDFSPLHTGCQLWEVHGESVEHIYTFNKNIEVEFGTHADEKYINFSVERIVSLDKQTRSWLAYYNLEKGRYIGFAVAVMEADYDRKEILTVGDYQFYVNVEHSGGWGNGFSCYYLHRISNGQDEILQYYFVDYSNDDEVNPVLFADIHIR